MSSVDPSVSIDARPHWLQALQRVLRPVVKLLIRSGIRYDEFIDVARSAYVESALRDGIGEVKHPTLDQVAWATGIGRNRLEHYIDGSTNWSTTTSSRLRTMMAVLHRWHTDPQYLSSSGLPLELEISPSDSCASFERLVSQVDHDADREEVLDGLIRAQSVSYSGESRVRALSRFLIWSQGSISGIEHVGGILASMIATHARNFNSVNAEDKRLERSVYADHGLSPSTLASFQAFATERGTQFLCELDDWLAQHTEPDTVSSEPKADVGVNIFFYADPPIERETLSSLVQQLGEHSRDRRRPKI
ncbi:MAG: DUF6502 family protein [Pseudomonadota bacterium]|jgi:hypothetical protein|nr:DUF6502 family protein [Pseudomonadota bacterium]